MIYKQAYESNNESVLSELSDSVCKWVEIVIETLSQKSIFIHEQGTNLSKIKDMLKRLRDYNLPFCSFICESHFYLKQNTDEMKGYIHRVCHLLKKQLFHAVYCFTFITYFPDKFIYKMQKIFKMKIKTHDYKSYNKVFQSV